MVGSWRGEEEERSRTKGGRDSENKIVECERRYKHIHVHCTYDMHRDTHTHIETERKSHYTEPPQLCEAHVAVFPLQLI